jgi:hypothetical protein
MRRPKPQYSEQRPPAAETVPSTRASSLYPSILREYASSGFRDGAGSRPRTHGDSRPSGLSRRLNDRNGEIEAGRARERYGELGPFWSRKG